MAAGKDNRWSFPSEVVVRRWQDAGARVLVTGDTGAISQRLCANGLACGRQDGSPGHQAVLARTLRPAFSRPGEPAKGKAKFAAERCIFRFSLGLRSMVEIVKAGGWLMAPIVLCAIIAMGIILERYWTLAEKRVIPEDLTSKVWAWVKRDALDQSQIQTLHQGSRWARSWQRA